MVEKASAIRYPQTRAGPEGPVTAEGEGILTRGGPNAEPRTPHRSGAIRGLGANRADSVNSITPSAVPETVGELIAPCERRASRWPDSALVLSTAQKRTGFAARREARLSAAGSRFPAAENSSSYTRRVSNRSEVIRDPCCDACLRELRRRPTRDERLASGGSPRCPTTSRVATQCAGRRWRIPS